MCYDNYKAIKHGAPLEDKEPTPEQIMALHTRVVTLGFEPYADFSILTPYGRRTAKRQRHRSWILQEDGSYQPVDLPGPASFEQWEACWGLCEVILFMLRFPSDEATSSPAIGQGPTVVLTPIAAETY